MDAALVERAAFGAAPSGGVKMLFAQNARLQDAPNAAECGKNEKYDTDGEVGIVIVGTVHPEMKEA